MSYYDVQDERFLGTLSDLFLSRIRIYPIKACAGTDVQEARMDERGLEYDRRWMLVSQIPQT